ncbi:MAG: hypothetical protein B193_2156 [Solidesulfovibrio magneticus str. Maddingley MBC34]|uniref:DUF3995 domain-containing protein n=1 Tax=Solidesulfovibrio magneticus str. Maddingley MBC34 TaxID=1206767 RepID=K6GQC9_9BACT|nr:MAG: hypothetical protein B193_2156 [Solidesulfovibrio magneticus str. Maddingley MBC34]
MVVTFLAMAIAVELAAIAALHVYWAFGGLWPGTDVESLVRTVVGVKNMRAMPSRPLTLAVAMALFAAGLPPLAKASLLPLFLPAGLVQACLLLVGAVFALRGVAPYLPFGTPHRMEPFATLDRRLYGPLCLVTALAYAVLWAS